jgi:hypothetical protein
VFTIGFKIHQSVNFFVNSVFLAALLGTCNPILNSPGADLGFFVPQSKFLADGVLSALGVVSTGRGRLQAGGGSGR